METKPNIQKKPYETPEIQVFELDRQPMLIGESKGGYQQEYD